MCPHPLRCSVWTREEEVDPIATAGHYDGFLLVEWPLPWPSDLGAVPELRALAEGLARAKIRLQGLVAPDMDRPERRRLILYRRPAGDWFGGYERVEASAPMADLVSAGADLVGSGSGAGGGDPSGDVLVCTHGSRDVCCGSAGSALVSELHRDWEPDGRYRLWRTSHTGGHRFAPTAFVFPHGSAWAYLDSSTLYQILGRRESVSDVLACYRGCAGLPTRSVQAVDREVFGRIGWGYFDCERRGWDTESGRTRLEVRWLDGAVRAWEATVESGRVLPVPVCRRPLSEALKSESELIVSDLIEAV